MGSVTSKSSGGQRQHIGKLYFDPEADSPTGKDYFITDAELRERLGELVDESEKILEVRYYTNPLSSAQLKQIILNHAYIVFETDKWWWSIEKNENGVTVQRSKKIEFVRDYYRRERRTMNLFLLGLSFCERKCRLTWSRTRQNSERAH